MNIQNYLNCEKLDKNISEYAKKYKRASPFPHIIIEDFLKKDCINNTLKGFKNVNWASYNHFNENKSENKSIDFDPLLNNTIKALNSKAFLQRLEEITDRKFNLGSRIRFRRCSQIDKRWISKYSCRLYSSSL